VDDTQVEPDDIEPDAKESAEDGLRAAVTPRRDVWDAPESLLSQVLTDTECRDRDAGIRTDPVVILDSGRNDVRRLHLSAQCGPHGFGERTPVSGRKLAGVSVAAGAGQGR
jgi:hypothetical protein